MDQRIVRQLQRLHDLHAQVEGEKYPEEFLRSRRGRSLSSLEEELVSRLPLFDESEEQEIAQEAEKISGEWGVAITDQRAFDIVLKANPELGKKQVAIGLKNYQHFMQLQFYEQAKGILALSREYEFPADYELVTPADFLFGHQALSVEKYHYLGSLSYRSVLYHLMRHLSTVTGEETSAELSGMAKRIFSGRRILELGAGPGFFLYALRELGADVTGIELKDTFRGQAEQVRLNILYGDARELAGSIGNRRFDIIFSKDFLTLSVTKQDAEPIMEGVYSALGERGLTLHQIDYKKNPEDKYFATIEQLSGRPGIHSEQIRETWAGLNDEQKEFVLRRNILNISLEHLERMGFTPLTSYRLDVDQFLTITLAKYR